MDHGGTCHLISDLQNLVEYKGNQDERAQTLSTIDHFLHYGNSTLADYAASVSQLVTVLAGLSAQVIKDMPFRGPVRDCISGRP